MEAAQPNSSKKKPFYKNAWTYLIITTIIVVVACVVKISSNQPEILKSEHHYTAGVIYHNTQDDRLFIPRDDGLGWTLNFANGWSYVVIALIALTALLSILRSLAKPK